jgi:hypothetical protein
MKLLHPFAGIARTLALLGEVHAAALPAYSIPPKLAQCQQGRCSQCGLK